MEFVTERCFVRPLKEEDLDAFSEYRSDLDWLKHQTYKGLSKQEYKEIFLQSDNLYYGMQFAIILKDTNELIGDIYLHHKKNDEYCQIGYTISRKHARQGYTYEVVTAAIDLLHKQGIKTFRADVEPENSPSIYLLEKLNFVLSEKNVDVYGYILSLD